MNEYEENMLKMYIDDMNNVEKISDEEKLLLLKSDNSEEKNKLANNYLMKVLEISKNYINMGVSLPDLICEGNLSLIEGIGKYTGESDLNKFESYIEDVITKGIKSYVDESSKLSEKEKELAMRANVLENSSIELSKRLDHTPSVEELAKFCNLPVDEVERLMKISLDALNAPVPDKED